MNLISAHPSALKTAFADFIKTVKTNPLDKVLIVLPSQRLAADLREYLAREAGAVSALYFADFTRLALNIILAEEDYKPLQKAGPLQNFIIKNILEDYGQNASRGYCAALKSAFLDLSGALAEPETLLNLTAEDILSAEQKEDIKKLALFYGKYSAKIENPAAYTYAQLFAAAAKNAAQSQYLKDFKHIVFYGIYDYTGLQLELFNAVCEAAEVTTFFPYEANPAYKFAAKIYEANILGKAQQNTKLPPAKSDIKQLADNVFMAEPEACPAADLKIISVSGTTAEIESAAKEILMLKEEGGIEFKDIALTARTLEPYRNDVFNILEQNKIPVNISADVPLLQDNFAAFIFNLFSLSKNNFYKDDVCAVITSPYFKDRREGWPAVIKKTGVTAGLQQWLDLLPLTAAQGKENPAASQLSSTLIYLNNVLEKLERQDSFETLAQEAQNLIDTTVDTEQIKESEFKTLTQIQQILRQISGFAAVRKTARKGEFLEEFTNLIKEQTYSKVTAAHNGVTVADVMALRGQSFKAVIIMGLNEGLMPAQPAFDPVLKDDYRVLLQKLGYPLRIRADRYDEEKLLFYFALSAASKSARLIYQRSGEDGKPKIPSLYLTQIMRVTGQDLNANNAQVLSRRPAEKYAQWPLVYLNRTEAELLICLSAAQNKPLLLAQIAEPEDKVRDFVFDSIAAAHALNAQGSLTAYDGITGRNNAPALDAQNKGISPSSLQNLYKCPARFLFDKITGRDEDIPFERGALSPLAKGNIYHKILEEFYKHLSQNNLFDKLFADGAKEILKEFTDKHLSKENYRLYGMYPIVWDMTAREMKEFLSNLAAYDTQEIQKSGLYPTLFEYEHITDAEFDGAPVKLRGKLDRVNISKDGRNYSITDYKTKKESSSMERAIFGKGVLQPPLYFEMAKTIPQLKDATPLSMTLLGIEANGNPAKTLDYAEYTDMRPKAQQMLAFILNLLKAGIFIINPSEDSCKNCRFEAACRKAHAGTSRRCKNTKESKTLREYHGT